MPVEVQELACREGHIGLLTLNSPKTLNALTEEMVVQAQAALDRWADDSRICLVILRGSGDRAFCAGGNIRALYEDIRSEGSSDSAQRFFTQEYRLNYSLHRFPKPVIGLIQGIVMGGGMGLMSGCRKKEEEGENEIRQTTGMTGQKKESRKKTTTLRLGQIT